MKKINIFKTILLTMLIGGVAIAADEVIRQDKVKIGRPGSGADKVIELDTGSGSNAQISSDSAQRLKLRSNTVRKGRGTNTNIVDAFDTGAGNLPQFRWNSATGKIEFSNDGLTFKDVGSGGGAGGGGVLLNGNPGFEEGSTNWTASGGTFAIETTLSNVGFGLQSGSWDPSAASQTLSGELVAIPAGLYGKLCSLSWYYKGGDANYKAQVFDGTSVIAESSAFTAETNFSSKRVIFFTCPSSGSIRPRFITSADAALIYLDDVKIGQETLFNGQPINVLYKGKHDDTCTWSVASTVDVWVDPANDASCGFSTQKNTGFGTVSSIGSLQPGITFTPPETGVIEVCAWGSFIANNANDYTAVRIVDEDTTELNQAYTLTSGSSAANNSICGFYDAVKSSAATLKIQVKTRNGTSSLTGFDAANFNADAINWTMKYVSFAETSEAIAIDKSGWRIDANLGGGLPALSTASVSSYTEITNGSLDLQLQSGSASAEVPCSSTNPSTGLTCSAGSESLGIAFTPPTAGTYEVCGAFTQEMDLAVGAVLQTSFQWVETPNNAQTILQESKSYAQAGQQISAGSLTQWPIYTCGTFTFADTSKRTLRMMYEQSVSGTVNDTTIMIDRNAAIGQRDMNISVRRKVEFQDAVKFTNLVTSMEQIGERTCRFSVAMASGSPVITSNPGSCISGVADNGVGLFTATFTNAWTSATSYHCAITETSVGADRLVTVDTKAAGTLAIEGIVSSSAAATDDYSMDAMCVGN